jgi:protein TonB
MAGGDVQFGELAISSAAERAASPARHFLWGCTASKLLHVAAAAGLYALAGTELLTYSPPSGAASVELAATFSQPASEAAAETSIEIATDSPGGEAMPPPSPSSIARQFVSTIDEPSLEEIADLPTDVPAPKTPLRAASDVSAPATSDQAYPPRRQPASTESFALSQPGLESQVSTQASAGSQPSSLPVAAHQPAPIYPPELQRAGIEGTVTLRLKIAADGSVAEARIERSSGYAAMDQAALAAVRQWRFEPARRLGIPVPIEVRKRFPFVIERQP